MRLNDGHLSPSEAQSLAQEGLSETERAQLKALLKPEHFASAADAQAALAVLGLPADQFAGPEIGFGGKLKNKLSEIAKKQIYEAYDLDVVDLSGAHTGVALKVKAQLLSPDDPLVQDDPQRSAAVASAQAAGEPITWALTGGGIYPKAGFGTSFSVGPTTIGAGFSAKANIGYSVIAPYTHEAKAALEAAKNASVRLPLSANQAKDLAPGTEVVFTGKGRIAANASIGVGKTLASVGDFITVGATAGISVGYSKEKDLSVRVKRLDGNKVFVSLSRIDKDTGSGSAGVHVGVDANLKDNLPDLGGSTFQKAGEIAADAVDKQIEKWLSADFRGTHTRSKTETEVQNYVIDLNMPGARAAYEDLVRLDARAADRIAHEDGVFGGVRSAKLTEGVRSHEDALKARFGKITLLSAASRATETHGVLETSKGDVEYHRAELGDDYSGILSNLWKGKRAITRALVSTQMPEDEAPSYHYHVRYTVKDDGHTSKNDVRHFLALSDALGAMDPDTRQMTSKKAFLKSFDDTDRVVDVFISHEGLTQLVEADPKALAEAYAQAYEKLDRPWDMNYLFGNDSVWRKTPWLATAHPKFNQIISLLEKGPEPNRGGGRNHRSTRDDKYRYITGRSLRQDARAYEEQSALLALVEEMKSTEDPTLRMKMFADKDREMGLDFAKELAMVASVAGAEHVLVNNLAIRDKDNGRDLVFKREGAIQDPRQEVQARLNNPT